VIDAALLRTLDEARVGARKGAPVRFGADGYSERELDDIEHKWGFRFPPDLRFLLRNMQDEGGVFMDWRAPDDRIRDRLDWPREGLAFDVEKNAFWLTIWDPRPNGLEQRLAVLNREYATWPRLIPIYGHRYMSAEPHAEGNPVLSVYQSDIIYYGNDLADYLLSEFHIEPPPGFVRRPNDQIRHIRIWSDLVDGGWGL
jgi:hypothetical protein